MKQLSVRNRQRAWFVDGRRLRRLTCRLLEEFLSLRSYRLGVHLISAGRMAELNRDWLGHQGATDVISFDHQAQTPELDLHGEIFLCPDVAVDQARRFRATEEAELLRYLVHGVLHLSGYDDREPAQRRRMKRRENQLLQQLLARPAGKAAGQGRGAIDFRPGAGEPWRQS
jgi:probable rRNA maturation factor